MCKKVKLFVFIGVLITISISFLAGYFFGKHSEFVKHSKYILMEYSEQIIDDDYEDFDAENIHFGDMVIPEDIAKFSIGKKKFTFDVGDSLEVNFWNSLDDEEAISFNDESYEKAPVLLYGNVSTGTKVEAVISAFNIKSGYANINVEVDTPEEDGTTDIVNYVYKDNRFFSGNYINAAIQFGYKRINDSWKMVRATDLVNLIKTGQTLDYLIFEIHIFGDYDEVGKKGQVSSFYVKYYDENEEIIDDDYEDEIIEDDYEDEIIEDDYEDEIIEDDYE